MSRTRGNTIVDPFTGNVVVDWHRVWNVQRPPFVHPLQFHYQFRSVFKAYDNLGYASQGVRDLSFLDTTHTYNKAYAALTESLGDSATWANNLLEAGESLGTVTKRAGQLLGFARALSRGHFGDAAKILGMAKPSGVSSAKSFGDNWLEYHFGWAPAVQDVGAAVNVLQKTDFGSRQIHGRASGEAKFAYTTRTVSPPYTFVTTYQGYTQVRAHCALRGRVENPNAFLANQMGFVNPLSVAWEAVPYSFVVDWFTNVGQVLASMSDFCGVEVQDSYNTVSSDSWYSEDHHDFGPGLDHLWGYAWKDFQVGRNPGIPGPTLEVKPFKGFSPVRAATAISLLLQHL